MTSTITLVCLDGATATHAVNDNTLKLDVKDGQNVGHLNGPVLIISYDKNASDSLMVYGEAEKAPRNTPLTAGAVLLEKLVPWPFDKSSKPSWLPKRAEKASLPEAVLKLYDNFDHSNADVVAIVSKDADCSNIVRCIAELTTATFLHEPVEKLRQYLFRVGKLRIPEEWRARAREIYDDEYKKAVGELLPTFAQRGQITHVSPTKNKGKVDVVRKVRRVAEDDVIVKPAESGQNEQPSGIDEGSRGAFNRGLASLIACKESHKDRRLMVDAFEGTMSEVPPTAICDIPIELTIPIMIDYTVICVIDTATDEVEIRLTRFGTPFPAAIDSLRRALGVDVTNAAIWKIFHPEVDEKNWHGQIFGEKNDRFADIIDAYLDPVD
ncbi:hypothetical protein VFPPC_09415 [Pochonia chlamydosporia 170]|uniref:Uncharacterized protein n=1 Tax=Pochonia chlamydosporia 170 TaxID=1380566 RepID=A0A179F8V0_METCM|nr:hypothetical protein VFPPC_09415 [Pochonia chlamydosporia 170]OAQ61593.1 hypothetical protein VFPPC_09415 [Pochonia chlamydosporia 170]